MKLKAKQTLSIDESSVDDPFGYQTTLFRHSWSHLPHPHSMTIMCHRRGTCSEVS